MSKLATLQPNRWSPVQSVLRPLLLGAASALLALPAAAQCPPVSTLPCDKVPVTLPYNLSFTAGVAGTIADKNGVGTGFTMVDTYSGTRNSLDGTPSNAGVPGYEASKLTVVSGRLQLVTNKGIASLANNNQLNTLGVQVSTQHKLTLQVTVVNPYYGTGYQQAGLWLGLSDKTFLKIVVVGNQVELRREVNDASGTGPSNITSVIAGLNNQTVRLRMVVDPVTNNAQGFYSTDGTNYTSLGGGVSTAGSGLTGATAYAGVFGTHRNGDSPVTYTFDDFSVTAAAAPAPGGNGYLTVESADKFPGREELTFSLIQIPWRRQNEDGTYTPYNRNHNKVKLKLSNKGTGTLDITALTLSNPAAWKIASISGAATSVPMKLAPGASVDALIEFTAKDLGGRVKILNNFLTISSNDALTPSRVVKLNGLWQYRGEGGNEPYAQEIIKAFGFLSRTGFAATDGVNDGTAMVPNSDEIMSSFFVRADANKPVTVVQMAAYHGCCAFTETFQWYGKGSLTNNTVFTHDALDGQSLLPLKKGLTTLAQGTFNPSGAFGIKVDKSFSDRNRNFESRLGMRFWKAVDANGNVIPDAYLMGGDYLGSSFTNYDYQDYIFYITNIRPETGTVHYAELAAAPSALNFGSTGVGVPKSLTVNLKSLGKTYPNGSNDPAVLIKSVEIVGGPAGAAFAAAMPATTTLGPQGSTLVNVTFNPGSRGLKNAALLVHYNSASSPLRVPLYGIGNTAGSAIVIAKRIKGGSDADVTIGGNAWEADINYRKGSVKLDKPLPASPVAGTDDDALYQTYLSSTGDFNVISYDVPMPNGTYQVRLHFAEMYWPSIGSRVFSIDIENARRLTNFDIYREAGPKSVLVKDYEVNVADGVLNLRFTPTADRLSLAGVEIFRTTATARVAAATGGEESPARLRVYPNPTSGGKLQLALEGFGADEKVDVTLYRLTGQAVQRAEVTTDARGTASPEVTLAPSLGRGLYLLKARGAARESQARVVIR